MLQLADAPTTGIEGADMSRAPGTFSPPCDDHEVLRSDAQVFYTTIENDSQQDQTFFATIQAWLAQQPEGNLVASTNALTGCAVGNMTCPP